MPTRTLMRDAIRMLDWSSLQASLIWIYEGPPGVFIGTVRSQEDIRAWLLIRGRVRVAAGQRQAEAGPGQWILPAHGMLHHAFTGDAVILSVRFRASWPNGEHLIDTRSHTVLEACRAPKLETTARAMERIVRARFPATRSHLLRECADYRTFLGLQRGLILWIEALIAALEPAGRLVLPMGRAVDDRVLAVAQLLDRLPLGIDRPTVVAAQTVGLSVSQLDRLFVRHLHLTPRRYLEQRHLRHACNFLEHTTRPLKELAYQLGFRHPSAFTTWFHQQKGLTPRAYRQRTRPV